MTRPGVEHPYVQVIEFRDHPTPRFMFKPSSTCLWREVGVSSATMCSGGLGNVSVQIDLPDELVRSLSHAAAERGMTTEELVVEAVQAHLVSRRHLAFVGMGHSGAGDLSENVKQLRREAFARMSSDQV